MLWSSQNFSWKQVLRQSRDHSHHVFQGSSLLHLQSPFWWRWCDDVFFAFSPVASCLLSTISSMETSSGALSSFSVENCNCRRYRWLWWSPTLEAWPANLQKFHLCAVKSRTTGWTGLRSRSSRGTPDQPPRDIVPGMEARLLYAWKKVNASSVTSVA